MIRYVIDASSVGPLVLPDEAENLIPAVLKGLTDEECMAPAHWRFEVGNLSLMAVWRKRADLQLILANLHDLSLFTVATDPQSSDLAWTATLQLAERHALTLYDAAYLELAQRRSLTLLSADRRLIEAALHAGLEVNTDQ